MTRYGEGISLAVFTTSKWCYDSHTISRTANHRIWSIQTITFCWWNFNILHKSFRRANFHKLTWQPRSWRRTSLWRSSTWRRSRLLILARVTTAARTLARRHVGLLTSLPPSSPSRLGKCAFKTKRTINLIKLCLCISDRLAAAIYTQPSRSHAWLMKYATITRAYAGQNYFWNYFVTCWMQFTALCLHPFTKNKKIKTVVFRSTVKCSQGRCPHFWFHVNRQKVRQSEYVTQSYPDLNLNVHAADAVSNWIFRLDLSSHFQCMLPASDRIMKNEKRTAWVSDDHPKSPL